MNGAIVYYPAMAPRYPSLNPEKALIWRIVHRENLAWIFENGLHCANSPVKDPNFIAIGKADLIADRMTKPVVLPPGGTLADYVPFYFTPFSPMMMNIFSGRGVVKRPRSDICILVSSLPKLQEMKHSFVFTDRHAYTDLANFYNDLEDLEVIDWEKIQDRDFKRNPEDPERFERYQAEALVYRRVPVDALIGVVCYSDPVKSEVVDLANELDIQIDIRKLPQWYL